MGSINSTSISTSTSTSMNTSERPQIENILDMFAPLADFTLIAGLDQEKVSVVRKLLTQKSVYFKKLLGPSFREGTQHEVTLQDIDGSTLTTIIKFIYSDSIDLTEECVANILDGASRLELVTLEKMCENFLHRNMSKDNCFQTFVLADKHCFEMLRASALECVATNLENIPKTDFLQLDGRVLGEILESGKVYMAETDIFNLLVEWVEQSEIRSQQMPTLLKSIRLEHLPGEFILEVAEPVFNRHGLNELISTEYRSRIINHQIHPRRLIEKFVGKNIFYAEFTDENIDIYKCFPGFEKHSTFHLTHSTYRTDEGWVFHKGRIYRMGGYYPDGGGYTSDEVECFDLDTGGCSKLPNMLNARSSFTPVGFGKYIYVFGGENKHGLISDCERFDIQRNQWKALPKMPSRLKNCVALEINGNVLLVGSKKYWCEYNMETERCSQSKKFSAHQANVTTANPEKHIHNVILDERKIHMIDTRSSPSVDLGERRLLLSEIDILRTVECAGSLYVFYEDDDDYDIIHKFGKIVFNGIENHIVDSVKISEEISRGFLFMK